MLRISTSGRRLWQSILRRMFAGRVSGRRARRPARTRLHLEHLEDRTVPSNYQTTFTVTQQSGTDDGSLSWALVQASFQARADYDSIINFDPGLTDTVFEDPTGANFFNGPGQITLDGGGRVEVELDSGLLVERGANVVFRGVTLATGIVQNDISNFGTLTVTDCTLITDRGSFNQPAPNGGAINNAGTLTVTDSTLSGNLATNDGGAIYNDHGSLTVSGCTFTGNAALYGGALFNYHGSATVTNCSFSANSAANNGAGAGGALYNKGGTLAVVNSSLDNNTADFRGGGIDNFDNFQDGTVTVTGSTLTGNSAGSGGGAVANESGRMTVYGSTLSGNSATNPGSNGGAIDNLDTLTVNGGLFSENAASYGGAIFNGGGGVATVTAALSGNRATNGGSGAGGALYNDGGDLTVLKAALSDNFADLFGGAIDNFHSGRVVVTDSYLTTNQAVNHGGAIDNESGTLTVSGGSLTNNTAAAGGALYNNLTSTATVSAVLDGNRATNNGAGVGGALYNNDGTLTVLNSSLTNNFADFSGGAIENVGTMGIGTTTVTGSTMTGNLAANGGAIDNDAGTLTIDLSTLSGNSAFGRPGNGGAIDNHDGGTLTITRSTLSGNSGVAGGAVASDSGTLTIDASTLSGNTASSIGANGGAIDCFGGGRLTMTGSSLTANWASNAGGAVANSDCTITLTGCTLSGNSAAYGGAVFNDGTGVATVTAVLSGNRATHDGVGAGGALYNYGGNLTVLNASLANNSADFRGGGIGNFHDGIVTVTSSSLTGNSAASGGGGIANEWGTLYVSASTLSGNSSSYGGALFNDSLGRATVTAVLNGNTARNNGSGAGGALYNNGGNLTVLNASLANNSADSRGGGIANSLGGTVTVTGSTLTGNSVGSGGGGIANEWGTLTVDTSTLSGNHAISGGALYNSDTATATVTTSTLSANTADDSGGGIANTGTLQVSSCTLSGNSATSNGGALSNASIDLPGGSTSPGLANVSSSTLVGNSAVNGNGGGIYNQGTLYLSDSTVSANSANTAGGVFAPSFFNNRGPSVLRGTIVAGNNASSDADVEGFFFGAHNLIGDGTGLAGLSDGDTGGDQVGTADNPLDPLFAPLGNYGGPTQTLPLLPGSPAISAGGALTTLASIYHSVGSSSLFTLGNSATVAVTAGNYVLGVDGEAVLASYDPASDAFTVLQRGYNATRLAAQVSVGDPVFLALDQAGRLRGAGGQTDVGAVQDTVLAVTANPTNQTVRAGDTATFRATAHSDAPITGVEWLASTDGGLTFHPVTGNITTSTTTTGSATTTLRLLSVPLAQTGFVCEAVFTNSFGTVSTTPATLTVARRTVTLAPPELPGAVAGAAYNREITATGGIGPYHYSITTGHLPTGITLNQSTGALTGTATVAGTYHFTVKAVDSSIAAFGGPYSATQNYTLVVQPDVASTVTFQVQPAAGHVNQFVAPFKVQVKDRFGNLVNGPVSLRLVVVSGGHNAQFTTASITLVTAVGGVATFNAVGITAAGTYELVAQAGQVSATSHSFVVS
jgi:hypothetical protein